ncbi:MAG TPA: NAD(P)/FAD-dependent oxidoreductase [Thermoanaerobaculia bacterium]|nr:NAD(P)/FAD-dependent oxidoreductase [Thermoanaerobaculia bacterium]
MRGNRVCGVLTGQGELPACFVVDAGGGGHWLARHLGLPVERRSPRLIAHYGYAEGTCPDREASPVLTADDDGWTWTAQVRPDLHQWTRLSLSGREPKGGWQPAALRALKSRGRTRGADVTWRRVRPAAGPGYYLTGDAAAVLDPASSHGVLKALMSGMLAAHRIVQTVRAGIPEEQTARSYDDWGRDGFEHDVRKLGELYTAIPAWKRRCV